MYGPYWFDRFSVGLDERGTPVACLDVPPSLLATADAVIE
jgi:hypothetical protein